MTVNGTKTSALIATWAVYTCHLTLLTETPRRGMIHQNENTTTKEGGYYAPSAVKPLGNIPHTSAPVSGKQKV